MSKREQQETLNEVNILAALDNEYIIKYYDSFITKKFNILNIVMEYAENGTLFDLLKKYVRFTTDILMSNSNNVVDAYLKNKCGNILFKY